MDDAGAVIDRALERLAVLWPAYEPRGAQREMALRTYDAFRNTGHLAVEAPTGVGKSIAYLVPSILVARDHRMRVVIATHTKNLQRQIIARDAPRVRDALAPELRLAVLKGRSSYLCMRAWERRIQRELLPGAASDLLDRVGEWITRTRTGDLEELEVSNREEWSRLQELAAPQDVEIGVLCNRHSPCFLRESRRRAAQSQVVIVNHALLLTHHLTGARVLPEYDVLVVDEAHTLPGVARDALERRTSPARVRQVLARLAGGRDLVLLRSVRALIERRRRGEGAFLEPTTGEMAAVRRLGDAFFREMHERMGRQPRRYGRREAESGLFAGALDPFVEALGALVDSLGKVASRLAHVDAEGEEEEETLARFSSALTEVAALRDTVRFNVEMPDRGYVHWYESEPALVAVPLEPGRDIAGRLLAQNDRVLFTSATLACGEDFRHFLGEVGLTPGTCDTLRTSTPFDLLTQVVAITTHMPDPTHPSFSEALSNVLVRLAREVDGKALVLLTSHRLLREVHERMSGSLEDESVLLLGQGVDGQRESVTERFRAAPRAMLLGTASFWEGVDFPGEELELLVVTRLPFPVPSNPVIEARSERIEASGRSAFNELMIPEAVMRLKQGFGRLIRRGSDRGVFVILDDRIRTARYRRQFTSALPVPLETIDTVDGLVARACSWLASPCPEGAPRS